jgi:hypothetical protein
MTRIRLKAVQQSIDRQSRASHYFITKLTLFAEGLISCGHEKSSVAAELCRPHSKGRDRGTCPLNRPAGSGW